MSDDLAYINPNMLTWAREQQCWTPREAAGKVGVKPSTWDEWESGERHPTLDQADEIAHALRIARGYLWLPDPHRPKPVRRKRWVRAKRHVA